MLYLNDLINIETIIQKISIENTLFFILLLIIYAIVHNSDVFLIIAATRSEAIDARG